MTRILSLLSSPRRRTILHLVWDRERGAGEIHRRLGDVTFGAVSQHLKQLEQAQLVGCRRAGRRRYYRARVESFGALAPWLEAMWDDALFELKIRAEMEEARRGPRPRAQPRTDAGESAHRSRSR